MDYPGKVITKTQVTPTQTSASGNWTLDDQAAAIKNNNWPVALVPNPISKSLRFNSADSAYLNRNPASSSNQQKWTWSGWIKRGSLGGTQNLFGASNANTNNQTVLRLSSDTLQLFSNLSGVTGISTTSNAVYRDSSAWYHIVCSVDTTQATSTNRVILYVNGSAITFNSPTYPTQNYSTIVNATGNAHEIGRSPASQSDYFNGYMTEINFIDGQQLTPSSFGMTNPQTGQWIPLKYSGTYGTNGFYLNFKDATSTTTLGYDYSGNANNWTTNNFSVTAGAGNDSLTDVPTPWVAYNTTGDVGGVIRGNYCTLNPLSLVSPTTLANGNLDCVTGTTPGGGGAYGTIALPSSGKFYFEYVLTATSGTLLDNGRVGIAASGSVTVLYQSDGFKKVDGSQTAYGASWTTNDVIGVAVDIDGGSVTFYKNNSSQGAISYTISTKTMFPYTEDGSGTISISSSWNFGQRPFAYTPPTGFRSLCTTNLPATAIGFGLTNQGDDYFNPVLYTGAGSGQSITGVGFAPDFIWQKERSSNTGGGSFHYLSDKVRGVNAILQSNTTGAESTGTDVGINTFDSDGFTMGTYGGGNANQSGESYVSWNWKAGGTGVTNTAGSITSTVSANTTAGFSVVTYTGTGSNATVGHGLGVAPIMVIVKSRTSSRDWPVYHVSPGNTQYAILNGDGAFSTASTFWNNTSPTSTVFSIGTALAVNASENYVAYCFAAVAGYSAFGSYTGNSSNDGPFIYTGFRPRWVMIKQSSASGEGWFIVDTARDTYNAMGTILIANTSGADNTSQYPYIDYVSNGFKLRKLWGGVNGSGSTYIYAAFAESPFQFANAR
jgi:hypothetical protein